jgi:hypothetical protein
MELTRCFKITSEQVKRINHRERVDLGEQFHNEAKRLLDLENGKVSVTTVQSLFNMFVYASSTGKDRAGSVFRLAGCEMFKRLSRRKDKRLALEASLGAKNDNSRRDWSRVAWGIFCLERYVIIEALHHMGD